MALFELPIPPCCSQVSPKALWTQSLLCLIPEWPCKTLRAGFVLNHLLAYLLLSKKKPLQFYFRLSMLIARKDRTNLSAVACIHYWVL